uniref:Uncharacterized protein n=1 Tax=Anguilla anguilla TaxID=7936 RepID=A0A0E9Y2S0_ANGAN
MSQCDVAPATNTKCVFIFFKLFVKFCCWIFPFFPHFNID